MLWGDGFWIDGTIPKNKTPSIAIIIIHHTHIWLYIRIHNTYSYTNEHKRIIIFLPYNNAAGKKSNFLFHALKPTFLLPFFLYFFFFFFVFRFSFAFHFIYITIHTTYNIPTEPTNLSTNSPTHTHPFHTPFDDTHPIFLLLSKISGSYRKTKTNSESDCEWRKKEEEKKFIIYKYTHFHVFSFISSFSSSVSFFFRTKWKLSLFFYFILFYLNEKKKNQHIHNNILYRKTKKRQTIYIEKGRRVDTQIHLYLRIIFCFF